MPMISTGFGDFLDPRFQKIFFDEYDQLPDMIGDFYDFDTDNGRADVRYSGVGASGDFDIFSGTVPYDNLYQAYDTLGTHVEFASGLQIERKLYDDDQYNIMNQRPTALAQAANRTRQKYAARMFNNAFSVDSFFAVNSEGVALCSNSHTTNAPGVSTTTGFDNLVTDALSAVAVRAARIQMRAYRDDRGNLYSVMPDELIVPVDLEEQAWEIVNTSGQLDSGNNNANFSKGKYQVKVWEYMTDTNNWFMADSRQRRMFLKWIDRMPLEFAFVEDFDTMVAKWRAYMRYLAIYTNWRFILGAQVS